MDPMHLHLFNTIHRLNLEASMQVASKQAAHQLRQVELAMAVTLCISAHVDMAFSKQKE